jgi:methyl-accepting chemotaxis protein
VLLGLAALTGCGSDDGSSASSSAAAPSPTPTPAPVVWADGVCAARDNLNAAVSALGRNLSYDVTSDRSALEQIDLQLRIQVLSVANAAGELQTAVAAVPVDFQAANDLVVTVTKAKEDTSEAVDQVKSSLDAMVNAENIVAGVAEAGKALVAGKAAFEAGQVLVSTVTDSVSTANDEVQAAFDAAPGCQQSAS